VLAASTMSPLHEAGTALFSAHMVQHELLVAIAAPLLALGRPLAAFAWAVPQRRRQDLRHTASASSPTAVAALFITVLHTGVLGALITSRLWYPHYGLTIAPWGLMPMEDQQLAGLVMWIPGSLAYLAAGLVRTADIVLLRAIPDGPVHAG
jgi:cytochrome c oxidase assembly factor CtaG